MEQGRRRRVSMAKARHSGNGRLEEALAKLLETQASMQQVQVGLQQNLSAIQQNISVAQQNISEIQHLQSSFLAQMAEIRDREDRRWAETLERFARIEAILLDHSRILQ